MTTRLAADTDAAMVMGIASTALPFARSCEEEAERWLRLLRVNGAAGFTLQALGVSEGPLEAKADVATDTQDRGEDRDLLVLVSENAARVAAKRGAQAFTTEDVLVAVMDVYGAAFERVLRRHGTDRDEVLDRLGIELAGIHKG